MTSYTKRILRNSMVAVLACLSSFGCTAAQLRRSTVAHSMTLGDIYTQQVLNNLAMFIQNPNSLPFFAFPNQGTTSDSGYRQYRQSRLLLRPFLVQLSSFSMHPDQATENWVLVPVSDPAKLALMHCAYQQAIASSLGPRHMNDGAGCPDCAGLRSDFYGPKVGRRQDPVPAWNALPRFPSLVFWGCEKHAHRPAGTAPARPSGPIAESMFVFQPNAATC